MRRELRTIGALAMLALLIPHPAAATLRWGMTAGPQWSRFGGLGAQSGTSGLEVSQPRWEIGPMFGLTLALPAGPVTIETECQLVDQRNVVTFVSAFVPGGGAYRLGLTEHHLSVAVPARLSFRLPHGLRLGAGPEVRYLARATQQSRIESLEILPVAAQHPAGPAAIIFEDLSPDVTRYYHRWTAAIQGSMGVSWPLAEHQGRFDVRYSQALTEASKQLANGAKAQGIQGVLGFAW